ncbi:unnamed protein product, partial [Oncorhynchus mykiss]
MEENEEERRKRWFVIGIYQHSGSQVNTSQVQVNTSQVNTSQVNTSQVNTSQVNTSQVNTSQVNTSQVNTSQVTAMAFLRHLGAVLALSCLVSMAQTEKTTPQGSSRPMTRALFLSYSSDGESLTTEQLRSLLSNEFSQVQVC